MHDESHSPEGPERRKVRKGENPSRRDELGQPMVFEYSHDGRTTRGGAPPPAPAPVAPAPSEPARPVPAAGLDDLICGILTAALHPKQRKFLETEAKNRGCDLPQLLAAAVCEAILERYSVVALRVGSGE